MVQRVQAGQQLGNYRLVRRLGEGGFAEVYLGEHRYLGHQVAIKVLTASLTGEESKRFLQEARTMAELHHPHIVRCTDFGIEQGVPFLVMEYAPGGTLRDLYPEGTQVPLDTVITYVQEIADALQYAHDHQLMHLDIKPENMLLGKNNTILLSDFGLARFTYSLSASQKSLIGTINYMAPEQIRGKPVPASDQYALATMAYEWLTGVYPFAGNDTRAIAAQHLTITPPPMRTLVASIPPAMDDVVLTALAKDPQDRYPTIKDFAQALAHAQTGVGSAANTTQPPRDLESLYRRGISAKAHGNLEQAEELLSEVVMRAPHFRSGLVAEQLQQVRKVTQPLRVQRSSEEAEEADRAGNWDDEIAAWNTVLQFDPASPQASEAQLRIQLAQRHKQYDQLYQDAAQFLREGNRKSAAVLLQQLWEKDRYYSDPANLARLAGLRAPLTYQQDQLRLKREEARQEQQEQTLERRNLRKDFRRKAYGPQFGRAWIACLIWFMLVAGAGTATGAYTQSWPLALLALLGTSVVGWLLGYRKALGLVLPAIIVILASVATIILTQYVAKFNYIHPYPSPYIESVATNFFTTRNVTEYHYLFLGRQVSFGLICGAIAAFIGGCIAFFLKPPYSKRPRPVSRTYLNGYTNYFARPRSPAPVTPYLSIGNLINIILGSAVVSTCCWALIAMLAAIEGWGFGFDIGGNWMLLGLAISSVLGIAVWASIPIWWTGIRALLTKRN